jgi:hypothetical protein
MYEMTIIVLGVYMTSKRLIEKRETSHHVMALPKALSSHLL